MTRFIVIGFYLFILGFTAATLTCPDNEVVNNCPSTCNESCPKSEDEEKESCPTPDPCPEPACTCGFNQRREDGTCIPTKECPPFDCSAQPNQMFVPCPPLCPTDDCSMAAFKGSCPPALGNIGITLTCKPACHCIPNHYRKDGICVPENECGTTNATTEIPTTSVGKDSEGDYKTVETKTFDNQPPKESNAASASAVAQSTNNATLTCPNNEIDTCPTTCGSCPKSEEEEKKPCPTPNPCPEPACKCGVNQRRENGTCISTRECPPFDCNALPNQRFDPCPALCPTEDCSQAALKGKCPFRIRILLICRPACRCIKNHYRKDGICVTENECGTTNVTTEIPTTPVGKDSVGDYKTVETKTFDNQPPKESNAASASTVAQSTNNATLTCPGNEVVNNCPTTCKESCPKSEEEEKKPCPTPNPCPEPACKCGVNQRRENGTCISTRECPPFDCTARPNEMFDPCPPYCPTDDCSQAALKGKCPPLGRIGTLLICKPTCRCIANYYRKNGICVAENECGTTEATSENPTTPDGEDSEGDCKTVETKTLRKKRLHKGSSTTGASAVTQSTLTNNGKKCGSNEEYKCKKSCPSETCISIIAKAKCNSTEVCKNGCFCKEGFLRANQTSPCMPECKCKEMPEDARC